MTPASQMLEKAMVEENQNLPNFNASWPGLEQKRTEREHKLSALTEKQCQGQG